MKLNTSIRKRFRVSNKVKKVAPKDRYRLCISRSSKNISAQIIDDVKKVTLLSSSSIDKDMKSVDKLNNDAIEYDLSISIKSYKLIYLQILLYTSVIEKITNWGTIKTGSRETIR